MKIIRIPIITIIICFQVSFNTNLLAQENSKLMNAQADFCEKHSELVTSLEALDIDNKNYTMEEYRIAFKTASKAWDKFLKSTEKLEKLEIKETGKLSSNQVSDENNKGNTESKNTSAMTLSKHIEPASVTIKEIMNYKCK